MKSAPSLLLIPLLVITLFTSCKKNNGNAPKDYGPPEPPASASLKGPVSLYMTDYYPDSFYHRYAMITVTSDTNNLYIKLSALNGFNFQKVKMVIGDFAHVKAILYPYSNPPLSDVGPSTSDYVKEFTTDLPTDNDITISRSTIKGNIVYIYVWSYMEKFHSDGSLGDWHPAWVYTKQQMNGDAATSYFGYNFN